MKDILKIKTQAEMRKRYGNLGIKYWGIAQLHRAFPKLGVIERLELKLDCFDLSILKELTWRLSPALLDELNCRPPCIDNPQSLLTEAEAKAWLDEIDAAEVPKRKMMSRHRINTIANTDANPDVRDTCKAILEGSEERLDIARAAAEATSYLRIIQDEGHLPEATSVLKELAKRLRFQ